MLIQLISVVIEATSTTCMGLVLNDMDRMGIADSGMNLNELDDFAYLKQLFSKKEILNFHIACIFYCYQLHECNNVHMYDFQGDKIPAAEQFITVITSLDSIKKRYWTAVLSTVENRPQFKYDVIRLKNSLAKNGESRDKNGEILPNGKLMTNSIF